MAIVGLIGVGKMIIINLLECFYDIKGGFIKLKGIDIWDLDCEDLWLYFVMVF